MGCPCNVINQERFMRASLKKIGLAAVMALTVAGAAVVTAGSAQAQHWHRHGGGGFGAGFVGGLAASAVIGGGPYYGGGYYGGPYAYGGGCYMVRRAYINRFGHRVIRRVRVCD
jgi:uncharacterized membrane protein